MIDKLTVDRILESARIEEVVGDFVSLKRRGANYVACCPFHQEKTPSFSVSPSKGIFKCFGCGKAGSVVTFVMEHEQMNYVEALKYLGNKYGIEVKEKEETPQDLEKRMVHESLQVLNDYAEQWFQEQLWSSTEGNAVGLSYFRERGFTDTIIKKFHLGYAPSARDAFATAATRKGFKRKHLLSAYNQESGSASGTGLCLESERTGELYDRYFNRVIFPWHSIGGKTIAFGGRRLNNNKEIAKYVNSPESELFVKNRSLYGIFEAKAAIVKEQKCYLVEGYTDVISFHQAGIENVVSSGGTSLTEGQIALIKRFSNKITVLYDGDLAGIKASIRGIDMLLAEGMEVKVALFPDGEDPDSFARKHSATELQAFLESHEEDFIAFKYELLKDDFARDPLQRAKLINDILVSISVIPDAIVRNVYMEETAKRLNVKEELLARELARMRIKRQESIIRREETQARRRDWEETQLPKFVTNTYCEEAEKEILYYLLRYGNRQLHLDEDFLYGADVSQSQTVAEYILCQLQNDDLELQNLLYKNIFNEYYTLQERDEERVLRHFANHPDTSVSKLVLDLMVQPYTITIENFKKSLIPEENILGRAVPKAILVYKAKITAQASLHLTEELGKAQKEGNLELQTQIMEQLNALIQVRNVFSKELKRITF